MDEETPEPPDSISGNQGSCYICSRDLTKLGEDFKVRKDYSYVRKAEKAGELPRRIAYFISLCIWCDYNWCQQ